MSLLVAFLGTVSASAEELPEQIVGCIEVESNVIAKVGINCAILNISTFEPLSYFSTFAKSMASTGAFIAADKMIIDYLKYNMRSQVFAKSLQMQLVAGILKRLEMLKTRPELRSKLWDNVRALQSGLKKQNFDLGKTQSCVTPVFLKGDIHEAFVMVKELREKYFIFCSIVVYPVIPKGFILLRLIPTTSHNIDDVNETLSAFSKIRSKLNDGTYKKIAEKLKMI